MLDPQEKLIEAAANRPKRDELLDCLRTASHLMHGLAMKMQELEEREDNFLRCKRTLDEQETRKKLMDSFEKIGVCD